MTRNDEQQNAKRPDESSSSLPSASTSREVARWADVAMYTSQPIKAAEGPRVTLLSAPSDPLGLIAAQAKTYVGEFVDDLADITDDERRHYLGEIQKTALAMPLEAVLFNFSITGVTRSFTHQMVRQRTAAYAQESMRFSVVEDGFTDRVALPPSLAGTETGHEYDGGDDYYRLSKEQKWRIKWDGAVEHLQKTYQELINDGMPAEDARGLLPHNITTRIKYNTNMRALLEHIGLRTCTQAQFEWRGVAFQMMMALREFGRTQEYRHSRVGGRPENPEHAFGFKRSSSAWQFDAIAELFSPICYRKGKCEMKASFDRKCSIRERVDANAAANRPSSFWHTAGSGGLKPISPSEWMLDPGAAR